jgi:hypothetical protein
MMDGTNCHWNRTTLVTARIRQPSNCVCCPIRDHRDPEMSANGRTNSCGALLVVPEQSAEAQLADELLAGFKRIVGFDPVSRKWPVADALMRAKGIVKGDVRRNEEVEMPLAADDEMSQAFILDRPDPPLDEVILVGRFGPRWGSLVRRNSSRRH